METNAKVLTAVALAVLGTPAIAGVSQPATSEPTGPAAITIHTGLTPADLVVGLDGTIAFDAKAHRLQFACSADSQNVSCTNCNC
jgi:hypothetical protein